MTIVSVNGTYLKNAGVNSGTSVFLKDVNITRSVKRLLKMSPTPGASTSGRYTLGTVTRNGLEFPSIKINGRIDINDSDSNVMTEKLLLDFSRDETNEYYLTISIPKQLVSDTTTFSSTANISPTYKGTNDANVGNQDNIKVELISIDYNLSAANAGLIPYSMDFIEVD